MKDRLLSRKVDSVNLHGMKLEKKSNHFYT
jgi:hypothetical protein